MKEHIIVTEDGKGAFTVIPETVGQLMGLKDKNRNEIYDGDILQKIEIDYEKWEKMRYKGEEPLKRTKIDVATMERFIYWLKDEEFGYEGEELEDSSNWEIIGNVHDNPELLKQE